MRSELCAFVMSESVFSTPTARNKLVEGCLDWVESHAPQFTPQGHPRIASDFQKRGSVFKAFSELGIVLEALHRSCYRDRPAVVRLIEIWTEAVRQEGLLDDVNSTIELFHYNVVLFATLRKIGTAEPLIEASVRRLSKRRAGTRGEMTPWRMLDVRHFMVQAGITHDFPPAHDLVRSSALLRRIDLPETTDVDIYAITHLIIFLSDVGRAAVTAISPYELAELREYVGTALAMTYVESNWDLTAELLISRHGIGSLAKDEPLNYAASGGLCAAQSADGSMPHDPWLNPNRESPTDGSEFKSRYHPTLVALLLAAIDGTNSQS